MRRQRAPLFLARAVYRQRRLRDAARLLPILGAFLLLLPLLWGDDAGAGHRAVYIFAVWAGLIALAAYVAPALAQSEPAAETSPKPGTPPEDS